MVVQATLSRLERQMSEHQCMLEGHSKQLESGEEQGGDMMAQLTQEFDDKLDAMQRAMDTKLKTAFSEIERLQKQLTVQKGESTIFSQQQKDMSRQLNTLSADFQEMNLDLNGDVGGEGGDGEEGCPY